MVFYFVLCYIVCCISYLLTKLKAVIISFLTLGPTLDATVLETINVLNTIPENFLSDFHCGKNYSELQAQAPVPVSCEPLCPKVEKIASSCDACPVEVPSFPSQPLPNSPKNIKIRRLKRSDQNQFQHDVRRVRTLYGYVRIIIYSDCSRSYEIFKSGLCRPRHLKSEDFDGAFVLKRPPSTR